MDKLSMEAGAGSPTPATPDADATPLEETPSQHRVAKLASWILAHGERDGTEGDLSDFEIVEQAEPS
jgi:hypothetical protein